MLNFMKKGITIKTAFREFCLRYPYFSLEHSIEYFSILGGIEDQEVELDYFETIFEMLETHFVENFESAVSWVSPSYLLSSPYREILSAVARGDAKYHKVVRKSKLSQPVGEEIIQSLVDLGILRREYSRETPLKSHPKHKLKKEYRGYKIEDKLRFIHPFLRFWFAFVSPYTEDLESKKSEAFLANFRQHYERLRSLVYEQLCDALLTQYYAKTTPLLSSGSYWNIHSEFDILAVTSKNTLILGECKYTDRHVCKKELTKLKAKALQSDMLVDCYVLFSKSGFSNELLALKQKDVLLFDLESLRVLL